MFEKNKELDAKADELFAAAMPLGRGDVMTYENIYKVTALEKESSPWKSVTKKWRKRMLRERTIATMAIDNTGFLLCSHDQQLNLLPERRQLKAIRQFNRSEKEVSALPIKELNSHGQRVRCIRIEKIRYARKVAKQMSRQQREAAKKTETIAKIPRETRVTAE